MKVSNENGDSVDCEEIGLCPCGGQLFANAVECVVAHAEPRCTAFDEMNPLDFVSYVRRSCGISDAAMLAFDLNGAQRS